MPHDRRLAVRMAAFAAAQSAKAGSLDRDTVERLVAQAARVLPEGDALRHQIEGFAQLYRQYARDPAALHEVGRGLIRFIDGGLPPEPPDQGRKDIHG